MNCRLSTFLFFMKREKETIVAKKDLNATGDLTIGTAIPGSRVRCVALPDMGFYDAQFPYQFLCLPLLGQVYIVRANSVKGVLLVGIRNPEVTFDGLHWEPCFSHRVFRLLVSP